MELNTLNGASNERKCQVEGEEEQHKKMSNLTAAMMMSVS
jgi:hypothetical protein